ncbi:MAG: insulinase family protein, partial [Cyanobacteria bacterium HKST-UBA06]|nr:insulinase family protein [Cyanobacteria bacterium HKST-UBA06]
KTFNVLNTMMYASGHPYQRDVIGTREIIAAIPRQSIVDYYNTWYSAPNMCTVVVGDFDLDSLTKDVSAAFDFSHRTHAAGHAMESVDAALTTPTEDMFTVIEASYQTSFVLMGFHGPCANDLRETIALDIACKALGEGRSSRLYNRFIEKADEPIFNMINLSQSRFKLGNVVYLQANFSHPDYRLVLGNVEDEIRQFTTQTPITDDEFDRAVKSLKVEFAETSETASGIAEALGESFTLTHHFDSYSDYLNVLSQVSRQDVERAAHRWLVVDQHYTAVMVPEA